jgi:septal ring factor EnvC (AmiA/AmiB activator)
MFAWLLLSFLPKIEPFLTAVEKFIIAHWKEIVIALMIGTIAYQNFSHTRYVLWADTIPYLKDQVAQDQVQIKKLNDDLDVAAKANATLATTIQNQNSTVDQWKQVSDQLQKKNAALQGQLNTMRTNNNKKVQDILTSKVPANCEDSIQFLRDHKIGWDK